MKKIVILSDSSRYLEYLYKLAPDSYMTDFSIITHNMGDVIASNSSFLTLFWGINMPQLEKSKDLKTVIPVFTTNSAKMPLKTCP